MAWIKSFSEVGNHPKTRRLARLLNIPAVHVTGHLHFFWHWCMSFAEDGDLTRYEADDIADAVEWDGKPELFLQSMIKAGFIDDDNGALTVHDWDEYGGKYSVEKKKDAERKKKSSAPKRAKRPEENTDNSNGCSPESKKTPAETFKTPAESKNIPAEVSGIPQHSSGIHPLDVDVDIDIEVDKESTTADAVDDVRDSASKIPNPGKTSSSSSSVNLEILNLNLERREMLNCVLRILKKSDDWHEKTIAEKDRRTIAKILHKIERDGRTLEQIDGYMAKFSQIVGRDPTTVTPPYPEQMLKDLDRVLDWNPVSGKRQMTEAEQLARMAELRREKAGAA